MTVASKGGGAMVHLTVGIFLVILGVVFFIGMGTGSSAQRRLAERRLRKIEAEHLEELEALERQEAWRKRGESAARVLLPWRSR